MVEHYHYPADVFGLLVDTIPLLCKGKKDLMLFFEGCGVPPDDLRDMWSKVQANRNAIGKYEIARDVLHKLNKRGDSGLGARREVIRRVVQFEEFSACWPADVYKAKSNVADLRKMVTAKDAFTRMKQERDLAAEEMAARNRAQVEAVGERKVQIGQVRERLNALFALEDEPQKRGKLLEGVLNDLFRCYGILVREDFRRVDPDGGAVVEQIDGVIELDGQVYLVEMKWLRQAVGVNELAPHMVRLFARADARGIFISTSEFSAPVIAECTDHLNQRTMILASLKEFVMLLASERDLSQMLRTKVRAALIDKRPFYEVLT